MGRAGWLGGGNVLVKIGKDMLQKWTASKSMKNSVFLMKVSGGVYFPWLFRDLGWWSTTLFLHHLEHMDLSRILAEGQYAEGSSTGNEILWLKSKIYSFYS